LKKSIAHEKAESEGEIGRKEKGSGNSKRSMYRSAEE
jgi:hypothetical protein